MKQPLRMKGKHMKSLKSAILAAAALVLGAGVQAQTVPAAPASGATAPMPAEFTNAEVRKVDKANRKISLKHEEIKSLGMPPMAMVFEAKDPRVLDKLKAGDKVRFKAIWEAGKYFVVEVEPAK
jgi:Cu(I)/Ag(I) efflux system periplasmic protein CusF